ncbi:hypothetical protein [Candidatus Entotheonella palauensis]|uniref:hypothetical protein n=1 Tax=Candidatus Entotheonella palauensis TaxID=93172 RepID=UPI000B7F5339|nr:hypothetical protein [Candidatus Entotheonella palauensis]
MAEPSAAVPFPDCRTTQAPPHLLRWHKRLSVRRYVRLLERLTQMGPAGIGTRLWRPARKGMRVLGYRYESRRGAAQPDHEALFQHLGPNLKADWARSHFPGRHM